MLEYLDTEKGAAWASAIATFFAALVALGLGAWQVLKDRNSSSAKVRAAATIASMRLFELKAVLDGVTNNGEPLMHLPEEQQERLRILGVVEYASTKLQRIKVIDDRFATVLSDLPREGLHLILLVETAHQLFLKDGPVSEFKDSLVGRQLQYANFISSARILKNPVDHAATYIHHLMATGHPAPWEPKNFPQPTS